MMISVLMIVNTFLKFLFRGFVFNQGANQLGVQNIPSILRVCMVVIEYSLCISDLTCEWSDLLPTTWVIEVLEAVYFVAHYYPEIVTRTVGYHLGGFYFLRHLYCIFNKINKSD